MIQAYSRKSLWLCLTGILLLVGCPVLMIAVGRSQSWLASAVALGLLLGFILWLVGLSYYAAAKGYSAVYGILGIFTIFGLLILLVLPDKTKKAEPTGK